MELTPFEQQVLAGIAQQIEAEDPDLATTLTARPTSRPHHRYVAGWSVFLGVLMFLFGAVLCAVAPAVGVTISVIGFVVVLAALFALVDSPSASPAGRPGIVNRWCQNLWTAYGEPPRDGPN